MNLNICLFLSFFFLWFFPGYYLLTHEAGHCLSAAQVGSGENDIYLACNEEEKPFYSKYVKENLKISVCPSFFYRFIFQKGYCKYSNPFKGDESLSEIKLKLLWISISGSLYGFVSSYIFVLLAQGFFLFSREKRFTLNQFLTLPFRLLSFIEKKQGNSFGKKLLMGVVCLGYLLHVERLFYGFFPANAQLFLPPIFPPSSSDGTTAWELFFPNERFLHVLAWISWFVMIYFCFLIVRKTYRQIKRLNT